MISINDLQNKWNELSPIKESFLLASGNNPLPFHIGYNNGNKCIIILHQKKIEIPPSTKAITAEYFQNSDCNYMLKLTLNHSSLEELFIKLCWDLLHISLQYPNNTEKVISQYRNWIKLFQKVSPDLLSGPLQKGLLGELLYLEEQIHQKGDIIALNAWLGPEGCDQDFVFDNTWTEIKTVSTDSDSITISSLQQLDCPQQGNLIIYFIDKISSGSNQSISLPETINKINSLLSLPQQDIFSCKLAKIGYFDNDSEYYQSARYRLSEKRIFSVNSKFPRLTRNNIPAEITNAQYKLSLAAIDPFKIQGEENE